MQKETDEAKHKVAVEKEFRRLYAQWEEETGGLSSPRKLVENWAYRRVVEMGWEAVPIMLRELQAGRGYWYSALKEITGEDPRDESMRGRLWLIRDAWLQWGRQHKYI